MKFSLWEYNQATNKPYGYILWDLIQNTTEELRVIIGVFDSEITISLPVNSKTFINCHYDTEKTT